MDEILNYLVLHCSPTLAGIKVANLFGYSFESELELKKKLDFISQILTPRGIYIKVLRIRGNNALIFVYRKSMLCKILNNTDVKTFLKNLGYSSNHIDAYIKKLQSRLLNNLEFPHEIGLFLGYPLHDVLGFIAHNGQNSKCSGCWKVYSNKTQALKLFAKYKKCREVYTRLFSKGRPIERLIIAA